jgi:hypothetical protein
LRGMAGMCQFEIALYRGFNASGGISFVLDAMAEGGEVEISRMSVYSRIFDLMPRGINDEFSVEWYKTHECVDRFQKYTKAFVEDALAFKAEGFFKHHHPLSTCAAATPVPNQTDNDCKEWHESLWSAKKREATVGRCELQVNGESHCVLKSKVGQKCTLYYADGKSTQNLNLEYFKKNQAPPPRALTVRNTGPFSMATTGVKEYPCDAGLTCTMDNYDYGIATCKKSSSRDRQ